MAVEIVRPDLYDREREVVARSILLEVDGVLQAEDARSVRAHAVRPVAPDVIVPESRDFR